MQGVKTLPANARDARGVGSVPALGRSPGEGNGNALQYFLSGEFHEQRSLVGYSHGVTKESDMTECTHTHRYKHMKNRKDVKSATYL